MATLVAGNIESMRKIHKVKGSMSYTVKEQSIKTVISQTYVHLSM